MKILITGAAGFIGFHIASKCLESNYVVTGIDNLNDYYDVNLKLSRLKILNENSNFTFHKLDLENHREITSLLNDQLFDVVIHMGARAGIRYSIDNPFKYLRSNIEGTLNLFEGLKDLNCKHFIFASTSSVYGANTDLPFKEDDKSDSPIQFYAVTKKTCELMGHSYSNMYKIPVTGLRFFTVYGPWGRPDMALMKFTEKICKGELIEIYNSGNHLRDFTYIDDVVESIFLLINNPPQIDEKNLVPYRVLNIGNSKPENILDYVKEIEINLNVKAKKIMKPHQPGDILNTYSSSEELYKITGFKPKVSIKEGVKKFIEWYRHYNNLK